MTTIRNLLASVLIAASFAAPAAVQAADNKTVGQCLVVAVVAGNAEAARRALALADNPRIAKAEGENVIEYIKRAPTAERRQFRLDGITGSCAKLGIRI